MIEYHCSSICSEPCCLIDFIPIGYKGFGFFFAYGFGFFSMVECLDCVASIALILSHHVICVLLPWVETCTFHIHSDMSHWHMLCLSNCGLHCPYIFDLNKMNLFNLMKSQFDISIFGC